MPVNDDDKQNTTNPKTSLAYLWLRIADALKVNEEEWIGEGEMQKIVFKKLMNFVERKFTTGMKIFTKIDLLWIYRV